MTLSIHSKRLGGPAVVGSVTATTLFTVPPGRRYVVKSVWVIHAAAGAASGLSLTTGPVLAPANQWFRCDVAGPGMFSLHGLHMVFEAGDKCIGFASVTSDLTVTLSGFDFIA